MELSLNKCASNNESTVKSVSFGEVDVKEVFWTIQSKNSEVQNTEFGEEYSELFKEMWHKKHNDWNSAIDSWRIQCSSSENQWLFGNSAPEGSELLGYCNTNKPEIKDKWIKVEGKDKNQMKIQVCSGDCFTSDTSSYNGWKSLSPTQTKGNWKEVKFQSKK